MNKLIALVVVCAALIGVAHAQQTPASPAAAPPAPPPPYGTPITLEQAKKAVAAAEAEAVKNNWKQAIAIVEPTGDLVLFQRIDGTLYGSTAIAEDKAKSAAIFRQPTKAFFDRVESGHPYVMALRGVVPVTGGIPIVVDGKIIGAIGVSGAAADQDAQVATAGASALK